jgi:autotransporter translocation and assembly factor TamB
MSFKKIVGLLLLSFLLAVVLFMVWIYRTESGLQWLTQQASPYLPNAVKIRKISGRLSDIISIESAQYKINDSELIDLGSASLDCQWLDLLVSEVYCRSIQIEHVKLSIAANNSDPEQAKTDALPALPNIYLSWPIEIDSIAINSLIVDTLREAKVNTEQAVTPIVVIQNFHLKQAKALASRVSLDSLSLDYQDTTISLAGNVQLSDEWQHQLSIDINSILNSSQSSTPKLKLTSRGSLIKGAELNMSTSSPIEALVTGHWLWHNGKPQAQGKLKIAEQALPYHSLLKVKTSTGEWRLTWPEFSLELEGEQQWDTLQPIESQLTAHIPNLMRGLEDSAIHWRARGQLTGKHLNSQYHSLLERTESLFQPNETLLFYWDMETKLDDSGLNTRLNAEIQNQQQSIVELQLNAFSEDFTQISIVHDLQINNLPLMSPYQLTKLESKGSMQLSDQSFVLNISGLAQHIQLPDVSVDTSHWSLAKESDWGLTLDLSNLVIRDQTLESLLLTANGDIRQHHIELDASAREQYKLHLKMEGQFDDSTLSNWKGRLFESTLTNKDTQIAINATALEWSKTHQLIDDLCLSYSSHNKGFCTHLRVSDEQWDSSIRVNDFELKPIWQWIQPWIQLPDIHLDAVFNGQLLANGDFNGIHQLTGQLLSDKMTINSEHGEIVAESVSIGAHDSGTGVAIGWSSIHWSPPASQASPIHMARGEFSLVGELTQWRGQLDAYDGRWGLPQIKNTASRNNSVQSPTLNIAKLHVALSGGIKQATGKILVVLNETDSIEGTIATDMSFQGAAPIAADLVINISDFEWLKLWQSRFDTINAQLAFNLSVAGSWQRPQFKGQGQLLMNQLVMEEIGLDIENSHLDLSTDDDRIMLNGLLQNKKGQLVVTGNAKLFPELTGEIQLSGKSVQIVDNSTAKVIVSPDLFIRYGEQLLELTGNIDFNEALIQMTKLPEQAVTVSSDTRIMGEPAEDNRSTLRYRVAVNLNAGDKVFFKGMGIDSQIKGKISAVASSEQPLKLTGQLEFYKGKFEAYKQNLTIEQGQLLFLGNPENPGIQFRATRTIDDIAVGVVADGTLLNPRLTLYSNPVMEEENILALLLTGRSLDSLNQSEGNALANAALSLGVEGANKIAGKIGDALGIKSLKVSSKASAGKSRVDIGAQVNDRLSVGYGTTIDSENELQAGWIIEYRLSDNLYFEATSGEEVSASISYKKKFKGSSRSENDSPESNDNKRDNP